MAEELGLTDADVDEAYAAMDWLLERQERIEAKLARRHFRDGTQVRYDVSSRYYEGYTCALMLFGHDRDGKKGKPIVVCGPMADQGWGGSRRCAAGRSASCSMAERCGCRCSTSATSPS